MNNNNYNSGKLRSGRESNNRFVSSSFINDTRKSSIAIICAILVLAIVSCTFFVVFGEFKWPLVVFEKPSNSTPDEPSTPTYIASEGGKGLYQLDLSSGYAILVRLSDMSTLAHKYADETIYPASMTKVMTVITALDLIENLDDEYVVTKEILNTIPQDASTAWLSNCIGSKVSVRDLIYGISYMSGADSVLCLLDYLNLSLEDFVTLMNQKAEKIGLQNTRFGGAIGMDTEENQTTCRDMAAIMAYAMENEDCVEFFGGSAYKLDFVEMTYYNSTLTKTLNNMGTNPQKVLGENYTLVAAKSGLEDKAGYCLVSYIRNNETGEYFVLVTAKAERSETYPPNRHTIIDMVTIFDAINP